MKTIIIGAGCAGLTVAHHLLKAGEDDFVILEERSKAGGRMTTYSENGYHVDLAAQLVHPGYVAAKAIIHDLGMDDDLVEGSMDGLRLFDGKHLISLAPSMDFVELGHTIGWMEKMGGPENFQKFAGFVESFCKDKFYEGSVDWFVNDYDDKGSFRDFVLENFGQGVLENFAEPVMAAVGLCYPEEAGIGFGLQIMWTVLAGEVSVLKNGIGSLAKAIAAECEGKIRTGVTVTKVVIEDGKAIGVMTEEDGFIAADRVVCAAQANHAVELLEDAPYEMTDALSTVTYCPCITSVILADKSKLNYSGMGVVPMRKDKMLFGATSYKSIQSPRSVPEGKEAITSYLYREGAEKLWDKSQEEIADAVLADLEKFIPGVRDAVEGFYAAKFAEANYIMAPGTSTAIKNFRDNHYKCVENLYLCGEYMYTGSYESAIAAGTKAAKVMLGELESI